MNPQQTPDNEVARLRELLNKTCDIIEYSADLLTEEGRVDTANRFRAKIAPAPEEPNK
jgi:hypothetical protein